MIKIMMVVAVMAGCVASSEDGKGKSESSQSVLCNNCGSDEGGGNDPISQVQQAITDAGRIALDCWIATDRFGALACCRFRLSDSDIGGGACIDGGGGIAWWWD